MKLFKILSFFLLGTALLSLVAEPSWVEVRLSLRENGLVDVIYYVKWKIQQGEMHGFYLEGIGREPHFNPSGCYVLYRNRKFPLTVKKISSRKYDVFYPGGLPPGEAIFVVHFAQDFFKEGFMDFTTSEKYGKLVVLNWAPTQWNYPLQHYTIYIHFPVQVSKEKLNFQDSVKIGLLTEKWVNSRYRIYYFGQKAPDGKIYFSMTLHRENLRPGKKCPFSCTCPRVILKTFL